MLYHCSVDQVDIVIDAIPKLFGMVTGNKYAQFSAIYTLAVRQ